MLLVRANRKASGWVVAWSTELAGRLVDGRACSLERQLLMRVSGSYMASEDVVAMITLAR